MRKLSEEIYETVQEFDNQIREMNSSMSEQTKSNNVVNIIFSECLVEDIEVVMDLLESKESKRYGYSILKGIVEQVILYKYMMQNDKYLEEYLIGKEMEASLEKDIKKNTSTTKNIINLKKIGQNRYSNKVQICDQAKSIGEYKSTEEELSLYNVYEIVCDHAHDGYHKEILAIAGEIEGEKESYGIEELFLNTIMSKFLKTYIEILE
jgi:hypothetical protein